MKKTVLTAAVILFTGLSAQQACAQEQTVNMQVSGMTCGTCPISVRHRAMQLKGVRAASVDLASATATVTFEDTEQSAQAITELGYPATITAGSKP